MANKGSESLCPTDVRDRMIALRHELHRHPELSFRETWTAERLQGELAALAPKSLDRVAGTGLVARIAGTDPSMPVVAIRGDVDALPIQEETGVDFASANDGVMHACGHDVHAAWAVGAAHLLSRHPAAGDVVILLQPAEESGRGAVAMIEGGALEGVEAIVGAHVDLRFEVGTVVAQPGPVAASTDDFSIELAGAGAHAARPHEAADPIIGAAALVSSLQAIVARRVAPGVPAVVTVSTLHAGSASNVIPERACLTGTLRAVDQDTRSLLQAETRRITEAVASAYGLVASFHISGGTPPLVNDAKTIVWAQEAARSLLGDNSLATLPEPNLGGEDFAFYLERIAGCFLRIGARTPGREPVPAHSARFLPADDAVLVGSALLAETARRAAVALSRGGSSVRS